MRNAILEKVTFHRIPNRSTNFWPLCLPVKMASKTVIKPIALCQGSAWALGWNCGKLRSVETCRAHDFTVNENESILSVILLELETCPEAKFNCKSRAQNKKNISEALTKVRSNWSTSIVGPKKVQNPEIGISCTVPKKWKQDSAIALSEQLHFYLIARRT